MSNALNARMALAKHGFHYSHSLGQNFILDDALTERIADAAGVGQGDNILEIGPGAGVLTAQMAARGAKVLAVEIDRALEGVLADVLGGYPLARVIFADAMKLDIAAAANEYFQGGRFSVVANLPYYITSDIITRLLEISMPLDAITVMVQREAAERMMAAPGQKAYCALAATIGYFGRCEVLLRVPPEAFFPRPHVESCLMRIALYGADKPVTARDEALLLRLIGAAFAMRRKTLQNNLTHAFGMDRQGALTLLETCGLDEKVRGEALSLAQLARLADAMKNTQDD